MRPLRWSPLLGLVACTPAWDSDGGTFSVQAADLSVGYLHDLNGVRRVLEGSQTRLNIEGPDCATVKTYGPIREVEEGVVRFVAPGTVTIQVHPTDCAPTEAQPDQLNLWVVPPIEVSGAAVEEESHVRGLWEGGALTDLTAAVPQLFDGLGDDVALPSEAQVKLRVRLAVAGQTVAVGAGAGQVEVTGARRAEPVEPLEVDVWTPGDGAGDVQFVSPEATYDLFGWRTVRPEDYGRVHILTIVWGGGYLGALAWVEDQAGRRVLGVPVRWEIQARHHPEIPDPIVGALLLDAVACLPPSRRGGTERISLTAHVGERSDRVTLDVPIPEPVGDAEELARQDELFYADPDQAELCRGVPSRRGCGCATGVGPVGPWVALLAGLMRRRGRRVV